MNYLRSPQTTIKQNSGYSLLRLPSFTILLILVGQLFIAGCGGSDSNGSGSVDLETEDRNIAPDFTAIAAAPLPGDPTLNFESPAHETSVPSTQDLVVKIAASDDGGIEEVRLWSKEAADAKFTPHYIGALNAGFYEWNLGKLPVGAYRLNAKVFANDGGSVVGSITITVTNEVPSDPTVTFDSPADGQEMPNNQDVIVKVTAGDDSGIQGVYLWSKEAADATYTPNGTGVLNAGFYEWNLGTLPVGEYRLNARASAIDGGSVVESITFTVINDLPSDPTLSFDSPADGANIPNTQDVIAKVTAADDGGIDEVLLWSKEAADTTYTSHGAGVLNNGTYQWNLGRLAPGSYRLNAKVFATDGGSIVQSISITISNDLPSDPTLTFNSPANGAEILDTQDVVVNITAVDDSGIQDIILWSKEAADALFTSHDKLTGGTCDWNLGKLAVGTYMLRAKATANDGGIIAENININVIPSTPGAGPTVYFVSPTSNLTQTPGYVVSIEAGASDDTGVTSVELLHNGNSVQTLTAEPYSFAAITLTDAGTHTFELVATDRDNNTATATRTVTITPETGEQVIYDANVPQLVFAAQELIAALAEKGDTTTIISLSIGGAGTNAYKLAVSGTSITVNGKDANETMYGGLEVAENLKLGLPITSVSRSPLIKKRGIKFNIPLDARSPSYDDGGDSANLNVKNMWDFNNFWKPYIDNLARCRYNVLSLWTRHPFPHIVDLSGKYPTINSDPQSRYVYRVKDGVIKYNTKGKTIVDMLDPDDERTWEDGFLDDGTRTGKVNLSLLTRVDGQGIPVFDTIQKKINHWQKVFNYAKDRGLETSMIYWNVFTPGAVGHKKDGANGNDPITQMQTDDATIEYVRYAVKQFILTYPQIKAIGVIAGEHDKESGWSNATEREAYNSEHYVYKTYGQGLKDALREQPGRNVNFIWRAHSMDINNVVDHFMPGLDPSVDAVNSRIEVQGSIKYCIGRLHSSRTIGAQEWDRADDFVENIPGMRVWLNIRNDDIFMHRWGSPDYVREFVKYMAEGDNGRVDVAGFYMGSDGYVWAKDNFTTTPGMNGQLEIDKHWYNFRLWGQLAYNNDLGDAYWTAQLKHRFGLTNTKANKLFNAWEQVSEVAPEVIRSHWASSDAGLSIEGALFSFGNSTGFIPFYKFFYNEGPHYDRTYTYKPMNLGNRPASIELPSMWIPDWGLEYKRDKNYDAGPGMLTPLEVADRLDGYADAVDAVMGDLDPGANPGDELQELLWDMQSMAKLGRYFADRTRAAAYYWVARDSSFSNAYDPEYQKAKMYINAAQAHWVEYSAILDKHYIPQVLARTHNLDWHKLLETRSFGGIIIQNIKAETRAIETKITKEQIQNQTWTP